MAYSTDNPPAKVSSQVGGFGTVWMYKSADTAATVNGADYFSNGADLGMKVGDPVIIANTTTPKATMAIVTSVTAGGAATTVA